MEPRKKKSNKRSKGRAEGGIHVSFCCCQNDSGETWTFHSNAGTCNSFMLVSRGSQNSFFNPPSGIINIVCRRHLRQYYDLEQIHSFR